MNGKCWWYFLTCNHATEQKARNMKSDVRKHICKVSIHVSTSVGTSLLLPAGHQKPTEVPQSWEHLVVGPSCSYNPYVPVLIVALSLVPRPGWHTVLFSSKPKPTQFFHHQDGTITSWRYSDLLLLNSMVSHFPGPSGTLTFSFPFLTPATGTQGSPLLQTAAEAFHAGPGLGAGTQDGWGRHTSAATELALSVGPTRNEPDPQASAGPRHGAGPGREVRGSSLGGVFGQWTGQTRDQAEEPQGGRVWHPPGQKWSRCAKAQGAVSGGAVGGSSQITHFPVSNYSSSRTSRPDVSASADEISLFQNLLYCVTSKSFQELPKTCSRSY